MHDPPDTPFTAAQLPEVVAALMAMSDINRFSHVVMTVSPVSAPFGLRWAKSALLRLFGAELRITKAKPLVPGKALRLLPSAPLPGDMTWAESNPRIAEAVSRWAATVEREAQAVVSADVQRVVAHALQDWRGELMPIGRSWVEAEIAELRGEDRSIARLALVLSKAPYQVDAGLVDAVLAGQADQARFIRLLAWCSYVGARRFAAYIAEAAADRRASVAGAAVAIARTPRATPHQDTRGWAWSDR